MRDGIDDLPLRARARREIYCATGVSRTCISSRLDYSHTDHPIVNPKDLEGHRVGVSRGYSVTTGVWARAILQEEYGVDLSKVTWVLTGDEHVEAYQAPPNVESIAAGETIEEQLESGKLAAAINIKPDRSNFRGLIENPHAAGLAAYQDRGHYPINHLIVIRDAVLDAHPDLAVALFDTFTEAKNQYLQRLSRAMKESPDATDELHLRVIELGGDPLPYGIGPNRQILETLVAHAQTQKILTQPTEIESLFAPSTHSLTG